MRSQGSNRQALESELRRALERDEIKLFFQPVVRLEDRTVAGFDTVLRWQHPRLGRIEPSEFIPLAEETGLICDLGLFALQRAARELAAWQKALDVTPPIFVTVNVSSRQMLRHDLLADVKNVLARSQYPAVFAQAGAERKPGDGKSRNTRRRFWDGSRISASGWRSMILAPAIPRWPICSASPSTPSRSTAPSPARKPRRPRLHAALNRHAGP